jgi:hypothetical protein
VALKKPQQSLKSWTKQKWRTKSGKPSGKTGERYLPEKAIKSLSSAEYASTTRAPNMLLQQELNEQEQKPGSNL